MADKSPHQSKTKKPGKSIKEKRADKKVKADAALHAVVIAPDKKH
jgi:hypothetical protein